ncbi:MAG: hypothetical protein HZB24_07610 [Desulfobacterales bacterium]|nr:hypothetical protein [Desulfobacterales bacterium]
MVSKNRGLNAEIPGLGLGGQCQDPQGAIFTAKGQGRERDDPGPQTFLHCAAWIVADVQGVNRTVLLDRHAAQALAHMVHGHADRPSAAMAVSLLFKRQALALLDEEQGHIRLDRLHDEV